MAGRKKTHDFWVVNSKKYKPDEHFGQKKMKMWKGKNKKKGRNHIETRKQNGSQQSQKIRRKPTSTWGQWKEPHPVARCNKGTEVADHMAGTGQHQKHEVSYTRKQKRKLQVARFVKLETNGQELQPNREQHDRNAGGFKKVARRQRGKVRKQRLAKSWIEEPWDITDPDLAWLHQTRGNHAAESDVLSNENTAHSEEVFLEETQDQLQTTQSKGLTAGCVPLVDAADGVLKALLESVPSLDDEVTELSIEASTVLADIGALQIRLKELIAKRDDIVTKLAGLDDAGTALQSHVARVTQAQRKEFCSMFTRPLTIRLAAPKIGQAQGRTKRKASGDPSNAKPTKRVKPIHAFAGGQELHDNDEASPALSWEL
ncbi:hypothetical protein BN1723_002419 [Verticillium longisporum]|uniref:Uncharacterized protein n=1 Tax=Verticillium longisporum TaxID=100787 RepID=A0A0G4L6G8_VERLO|nr:hypothetical protein BN1723_002419 [Verticillium longisporum]